METEKCISCNADTSVLVDEHIDNRKYYVEGAGQLCEKCWKEVYSGL
jgi:hypothetical protein